MGGLACKSQFNLSQLNISESHNEEMNMKLSCSSQNLGVQQSSVFNSKIMQKNNMIEKNLSTNIDDEGLKLPINQIK